MPEVGGVFVQAESEVSAINMVYGASGAGARVLTSSASPGMSLKMEGISYIAGADLPCVVVNIMRAGPGLGGLAPMQADYYQAVKSGGHGDYRSLVYAPTSIQEAVDLTQRAFDKSDEYRMPAIILGDAVLGQMMEPVIIKEVEPVKVDKSWASVGWKDKSRKRAEINSLYLVPAELEQINLAKKARYDKAMKDEVIFKSFNAEDCDILIVAFGLLARIARSVVENADKSLKIGLFNPISLWPYPTDELARLAKGKKAVVCAEMSLGQMVDDVRIAVSGSAPVHFYGRTGGMCRRPKKCWLKYEV
jgi:2-oxoglutarate ferredoxin oxidoreductase subunit alpha